MKQTLIKADAQVKKSTTHGYGVFAARDFAKGEVIEECYALIIKSEDLHLFGDYSFYWPTGGNKVFAIATGFGSIYNHSNKSNAKAITDVSNQLVVVKARLPIQQDEEIFISYGDNWFKKHQLEVRD